MIKNSLIASLGPRSSKAQDEQLLSKIVRKTPAVKIEKANSIKDKLDLIQINVDKHLSFLMDKVDCIRDEQSFTNYITDSINAGIIAIDTETTGLNPLEDVIIGLSLYTPGNKAVYIPVRHKSYITGAYLDNQLSPKFLATQLNRLNDASVDIIMHNAKFDIRMFSNDFKVFLKCKWDTMIASKLLDNTESAALKFQYANKILHHEKTYDFGKLFDGIDFMMCPVKTATPYAAGDALETYELYKYQTEQMQEVPDVYNVFSKIEMPLLEAVCHMEDYGIGLDFDFSKKLSEKYHKLLTAAEKDIQDELGQYGDRILSYNLKNPGKLSTPINIGSPVQLAILLYDILNVNVVDKNKPRGTGEEILTKIKLPLCEKILVLRGLNKLLGTYIDKLPQVVDKKDKRVHASFNQVGTDTGRFSSSDPNLQNIPSHNKEIRMMFRARPGYVLVSSDYSQQEPRLLAHYSQDEHMMENYKIGGDLYASIASKVYKVPYDECKEFRADGTQNPEGKKRRSSCKNIVLGLMYGRGASSIAEQIGSSTKEAQAIIDNFYIGFPKVKEWMDKTKSDAKKTGYVETLWGRRRRLPDIVLDEYEFENIGGKPKNFNPLDFDSAEELDFTVDNQTKEYYIKKLKNARGFMERNSVKAQALQDGIKIKDNGGFISESERQAVNTRIQGSAGDMSKLAMLKCYQNKELQELGFEMLVPVHDEIIGEAPIENAKRCGELLSKMMVEAAMEKCTVPMKCDCSYTVWWCDIKEQLLDDEKPLQEEVDRVTKIDYFAEDK